MNTLRVTRLQSTRLTTSICRRAQLPNYRFTPALVANYNSKREDDSLLDKARTILQDTKDTLVEKAKDASKVVQDTLNEAKKEAEDAKDSLRDVYHEKKGEVKQATKNWDIDADKAASEAKKTAEDAKKKAGETYQNLKHEAKKSADKHL
jgi:vacuolar-type H+-ATPase subunit H